jgi:16S rRNA (uracil1498-N3)-methyltransferase
MVKSLGEYEEVYFAYELANQPLNMEKLKKQKNIAIIIGSEGGFSEKEAKLLSSCKNVTNISLGKRILRAETASIVLSAIVLFSVGELN